MLDFHKYCEQTEALPNKDTIIEIAKKVYASHKTAINKRFLDGQATCTYASFELGKALTEEGIDFTVCSGDYKDGGHWWILVSVQDSNRVIRMILDMGDNITEANIDSGKIPLKILVPTDHDYREYQAEEYLTWAQYKQQYSRIKDY